jgi:uncharacterized protein YecT (DUF1311 family)
MRLQVLALVLSVASGCGHAADAFAEPKHLSAEAGKSGYTLADSGCGGEGHLADVQCLGRYLRWLDGEMNSAYALALTKLPIQDSTDDRRSREQLRKSQRAWLRYKAENCALAGSLEGGSNLWVTHFAGLCEERETKDRIKFLGSISK